VSTNGTTHHEPAHAEPQPPAEGPARIVLVGRTGLDGVLAAPASTDLVRVRSGMDALGEVSAWARNTHGAQGEQVVVLGEAIDADPTLLRARRFVEALRRLDPDVRVLAVGRPLGDDGEAEGAEAFDGWLDIDDPVYSSRVLLHGRRSGRPKPAEPGRPLRPVEVVAPEPPAPKAPDNDEALVALLLQGQPIASAALELGSARVGAPLKLADASEAPPGPGRAPLPGHDKVLIGPRATGEALEAAAAWLAGWLSLEARQGDLVTQANTDPLTGAWNRRSFDASLEEAIGHARAARRDLSVLVFDIDNFKQYNDQHGHDAGDEILREVVRLLRSVIRPTDRVCRVGGDEFAVIFDDPAGPREPTSRHPRTVVDVAHRFQKQVAAQRFPKLGDDAPGRLSVSGGLATFPWDGLDGPALLRAADQRAIEGKRQGKNVIELGPSGQG
jgi:diguanylate cyclase (GGDEF)-like protein